MRKFRSFVRQPGRLESFFNSVKQNIKKRKKGNLFLSNSKLRPIYFMKNMFLKIIGFYDHHSIYYKLKLESLPKRKPATKLTEQGTSQHPNFYPQ